MVGFHIPNILSSLSSISISQKPRKMTMHCPSKTFSRYLTICKITWKALLSSPITWSGKELWTLISKPKPLYTHKHFARQEASLIMECSPKGLISKGNFSIIICWNFHHIIYQSWENIARIKSLFSSRYYTKHKRSKSINEWAKGSSLFNIRQSENFY